MAPRIFLTMPSKSLAPVLLAVVPIAVVKAVVFSFTVVRSALPPPPPDAVFSLIAVKRSRTLLPVNVGSLVLFPIALRILLRYDLTVPPLGVTPTLKSPIEPTKFITWPIKFLSPVPALAGPIAVAKVVIF